MTDLEEMMQKEMAKAFAAKKTPDNVFYREECLRLLDEAEEARQEMSGVMEEVSTLQAECLRRDGEIDARLQEVRRLLGIMVVDAVDQDAAAEGDRDASVEEGEARSPEDHPIQP